MKEMYEKLNKKNVSKKKNKASIKSQNIRDFRELRLMESLLDGHPELRPRYKMLRDKIILSNGGIGMKYAIKYIKMINDPSVASDIYQQANIGIIEAVDRFDPERGFCFTTYAYWYIRKCIIEFIKKHKIVIAPREIAKNIRNITIALETLHVTLNGDIVTNEKIQSFIIKKFNVKIDLHIIDEAVVLIELNSNSSNNKQIVGGEIVEQIVDETINQEATIRLKSLILKELNCLTPDAMDIVQMRFGIGYDRPYTISEIKLLKKLTDEEIESYKDMTRIYLNK